MHRMARILHVAIVAFGAVALLYPLPVLSQQPTSAADAVSNFDSSLPTAGVRDQEPDSPTANPFERPASSEHKKADDDDPDSLQLHLDHKWISALASYAFTAPPAFYSFNHNGVGASDWDSSASTGLIAYLNRAYTSSIRMTSDFEMSGQRRESGGIGQPGSQSVTLQWEATHLIPTKLGFLEVAAGSYQQHIVSYAPLANSPLTDAFAGSTVSAHGLATSLTLPDKNLAFALHFGTQYLGRTLGKAHVTMFELSWTW